METKNYTEVYIAGRVYTLGGFEEEEVKLAQAAGFVPITLGKRILRTETAGLTVMSWLMYRLEEESIS